MKQRMDENVSILKVYLVNWHTSQNYKSASKEYFAKYGL